MSRKYEICLRLSPEEAERLRQDAKRCGLSKTAYLRRLIVGAQLRARPSQEIRELREEVHRIGNNIVRPDRALCKAEKWYCPAR